ncbi:YdaU family protein [Thiobacillus thioparus]|uniref:YdaU family protein n=1 Tax=Thiobacillus thioparus TaxID=931 RepID=UPI00037CDFBF|nr:DUF1376 domain-containing protein [Thiobacillus thioparus]
MSDARKTDVWMPLFIGDYLASTQHLDTREHGAYLLLLMACWRNDGSLPDDNKRLAAIVKATPREWNGLRATLAEFFTIDGGVWSQKRLSGELEAARSNREKSAQRAKNAARVRWGEHAVSNAPSITQATLDDCPSPSPLPKNKTHAAESGGNSITPLPPADAGRSQQRTQIDSEFSPDEQNRSKANRHALDIDAERERFVAHYTATGDVRANWQSQFSKWLLDSVQHRADAERRQSEARQPRPGSKLAYQNSYRAAADAAAERLGINDGGPPIERDITLLASRVLDGDGRGQ